MRRTPRKKAPVRRRRAPPVTARQVFEAFLEGPVAAAVARGRRVLRVNHPFALAVRRKPTACEGVPLADLLPPEADGVVELPEPGRPESYRTRLDGVAARVDLSASGRGKGRLVGITLRPVLDDPDTAHLKKFLEDLIENANALITVVNRERKVMVFNRALSSLVGRRREEVLGKELASLVPHRDRRQLVALLDQTFAGEAATGVELRLALATGGEASAMVNTSAIYGASGAVEGVMIVGQDQTLLRAFQERAEQAQKLAELGRLAAGIVHELNNPLTAVTVYADALVRKLAAQGHDAADVQKLRCILDAGERIHRFSRDLIAYARPPPEKLELVELAGVMKQAAEMCEPALRAAGATVERRLEIVPAVWGVRGSLLQVFVNLVTNAAHALEPAGGIVTLELAPAGDRVAARVKDDGPGMAPDVKRRAFEPFFTTKPNGKGSGLGLSIVQGIVARHGGAIDVESAPDAGSTFTVMLPVKSHC